ncbi:hypothetical protein FRC17_001490 [Serendipita sp. 399]|nr:hypothetical protein FRC17_001490 [Serendipita sp. 399]
MYFVGPVPNKFRDLSNPILRLIACATLGIDWKEEWLSGVLESKKYLHDRAWMIVSLVCLRDPPFFDGDYTSLWRLRLQLWIHFGRIRASVYLPNSIFKLSALKKVESELQLTQLGIDHAGDFLLAFIHLNLAYGWAKAEEPCFTFAPYILTGDTLPLPSHPELKNCIDHFSPLGDEINSNPSRLIRIMIELIRADINHNSIDRWPRILLHLLKHAITHIADKDLRPFSPSCRRLTRYIKVSYKQFESDWDPDLGHGREDEVVRTELKVVFDEVVTLLGSAEGPWDGEVKDISWPRHLLRPTGTKGRPFEGDDGGESDPSSSIRDGVRETGEGVLPTIEEAHE